MGQHVTEAYYAEETAKTFRERSAVSVIYAYPQRALAILAGLIAVTALAFWRYRRMKKRNEAHMQSLIDHDRATGLCNTDWLERAGDRLIAHDPSRAGERAVVVIRIVRPDVIAGTYGREAVATFFQRLGGATGRLGVSGAHRHALGCGGDRLPHASRHA